VLRNPDNLLEKPEGKQVFGMSTVQGDHPFKWFLDDNLTTGRPCGCWKEFIPSESIYTPKFLMPGHQKY